MQALQYLNKIEPKPKEFFIGQGFFNTVGVPDDIDRDLELVREYIEAGVELPDRFYRRDRDTTRDPLLEQEGVMHLHIGDDRSVLLFLHQFEDQVWAICITDHAPFREVPVGRTLIGRSRIALAIWHRQYVVKRRAASRVAEAARAEKSSPAKDDAIDEDGT